MSVSIEHITEAALSLPSDARALLADRLVESLDPLLDQDIKQAWAKEALSRLKELQTGEVKALPSDEVLSRIKQQLK